jgi:hypothetical protein
MREISANAAAARCRNRGPWRALDDLELITLEWVDWFNHRRLFEDHGCIPPAEFETNYYPATAIGAAQISGVGGVEHLLGRSNARSVAG